MVKDSAAWIELGRSFHQEGTFNVKVCESDFVPVLSSGQVLCRLNLTPVAFSLEAGRPWPLASLVERPPPMWKMAVSNPARSGESRTTTFGMNNKATFTCRTQAS